MQVHCNSFSLQVKRFCIFVDDALVVPRVGVDSKIHLKYIPGNFLVYLMESTQIHGTLPPIGISRSNTMLMIYRERQQTKQPLESS